MNDFLTIADIAKILKLSRRSIYRMMISKEIDFGIRIGGDWRFLLGDFNKWIQDKKDKK